MASISSLIDWLNLLIPIDEFFRQEKFWKGVLVAVFAAIAWKVGHKLWDAIVQAWHTRQSFDLAGHWVGMCWLPSYDDNEAFEIWRYSRSNDHVHLTFYAYNSNSQEIHKWVGRGIFRANKLSAYYYEPDRSTYESGVLALELKGLRLKGVYAQFDPQVGHEPFHVSPTDYSQTRISLPFRCRLRILLGRPPVRTFKEAKRIYMSVNKEQTTQAAVVHSVAS